jgi:hypothetical protein
MNRIGHAFIPCEPFKEETFDINLGKPVMAVFDGFDVGLYPIEEASKWHGAVKVSEKHGVLVLPRVQNGASQ